MIFQVWITGILFVASLVASQTLCGPTTSDCSAPTPCCSNSNSCGNTTVHCGVGCLSQYSAPGACISSEPESKRATPAPPPPVGAQRCGKDPTSGKNFNSVCDPPEYCCSAFGYCGVDDTYCIGCQKGFGRCPKLCDPSIPCGVFGMISFVISLITIAVAVLSLVVAVIVAKCNQPPVPLPSVIGFINCVRLNRNR